MTAPRIRVAAYITRHRTLPELLVFGHVGVPEAGTQVPAGGVESGEALQDAVLRETVEETGLRTATLLGPLAVEDRPHPDTGLPRRTTFFHLTVPPDTPDAWRHRVAGGGEDEGMQFDCRFVPLPLDAPLADDQDIWLARIDPVYGRDCS
ncbi:NUDIX domain-containing protein [Streptomyces sp. YIM 130001]|uniref:NUDIX hydrolase n=1 Tax=Streptomyces sp. YIM 130001 TaxID=2259644 RepID=UPI000E64CD51|nr:NUDIX domain-containing protein [Streptomyces sp. YIM 130001]